MDNQIISLRAHCRHRNTDSDTNSGLASGSVCSNLACDEEEVTVPLGPDRLRGFPCQNENEEDTEPIPSPNERSSNIPQVMITPSRVQYTLTESAGQNTSINVECLQPGSLSSVPFPVKSATEPQSTSSSVPSDGDKLAELPASNAFISHQRVFSASRKNNPDTSSLHTHESFPSSLNPPRFRANESENSLYLHAHKSREPLPKRTSFDNDRLSVSSSTHNGKSYGLIGTSHTFPSMTRAEEAPTANARLKSVPRPRSPSPLHFLFHKNQKEEPFLPVDPYKFNICKAANLGSFDNFFSQLLRQSYRHLLLRLPSVYFSRVTRVFTAAELSRPEVERMIHNRNQDQIRWPADHEWVDGFVSPAMIRFKESWECFIESVLKEWKTLNVVSALLLTAVLAILQIEGTSRSLVIRSSASLSLVCGLMSLVYGCVYILRFATMKSMYKAFIWAEETQRITSILWNIWVLLSMPTVWIAWSMIFFCISILAFVWEEPISASDNSVSTNSDGTLIYRTGHKPHLSSTDAASIILKVLISLIFVLGLFYFALVIRTFRSWRDTDISQAVRNSTEIGRWTTKSPSPGREVANALRQGKEGNNTAEKQSAHKTDHPEGKITPVHKGVEQKKSRRTRSVGSSDVFQ